MTEGSAGTAPAEPYEPARAIARLAFQRPVLFGLDIVVGAAFFMVGLLPGLAAKAFFDALPQARASTSGALAVLAVLVTVKVAHVLIGVL